MDRTIRSRPFALRRTHARPIALALLAVSLGACADHAHLVADGGAAEASVDATRPAPDAWADSAMDGPGGDDAADDGGALVDDASSDGGGDGGGVPSACPGSFVLCEDFERGIDAGPWTPQGTPAVDTAHARSGTHAIRFSANNSLLRTSQPFPALAHEMWGRVFVYMNQTPPGSTTSMLGPNASFAWAGGGMGVTRVGFRHTRYSGGYNYPGYDFTNTDTASWPLDRWVCVEWHYRSDPDAGTGTQDYWLDGAPRPAMHFDPHPMPAFTYFWIGMYLFGTTPYEMWMDDLALDTHQIGCAR